MSLMFWACAEVCVCDHTPQMLNPADIKTLSTVKKHQTKVISMCIVPVRVRAAAQGKNVLTYPVLDNYSQGSFIRVALTLMVCEKTWWKSLRMTRTVEESTIKSGDHYVVPLPFKEENLIMPENTKQAMQRLIYLKGRFKKDPGFFENYKQFMSNLLVKGYARRMDDSPVGRTWYILHHGVYHPSKLRKIRVVFDCSAQFAGSSLNQELLTCSDLTNPIAGVLRPGFDRVKLHSWRT